MARICFIREVPGPGQNFGMFDRTHVSVPLKGRAFAEILVPLGSVEVYAEDINFDATYSWEYEEDGLIHQFGGIKPERVGEHRAKFVLDTAHYIQTRKVKA